ncbi:hypothetical protein FQR65_LT17465 [Abscondita terminalis]|nr:hypothetical protein FQR65_LT17465 [Abscondita terminalis]
MAGSSATSEGNGSDRCPESERLLIQKKRQNKDSCIELINQYNTDLTEDKHKLTRATSKFIGDRLAIITGDLGKNPVWIGTEKFKNGIA